MQRGTILDQLLGSGLARHLADALFRRRARKRLNQLDRLDAGRAQLHALQKLVGRAASTRFGREHDFARIRTPDDFRRLVPLRTPADLWQQYGPALAEQDGVTWPGPVPYLASCDLHAAPLIITPDLLKAHRAALLSALALVVDARPHARLLSGSLLLVGGGTALTPLRAAGSTNLEELTRSQLPALLRPYTAVAPYSGDGSLHDLCRRAADTPVTCLVGNAGRLARLAGLLRKPLRTVWPGLQAILYSRSPGDPGRDELADLAGDRRVLLMEGCVRPEGVLAVEDPRRGRMRVLPDHGVYYEFVPVDEMDHPRPRRLGLGEIAPGVPYTLAVTSAAGLWACLVGLTVCFDSVEPPLLRSVEPGLPALAASEILPLRTELPATTKRPARSTWSARADRR